MANGINWEQEYGKSPAEMDEGEFRMAVLSKLSIFSTSMKRFDVICDVVKKHTLYWKIAVFLSSIIVISVLTWLVESWLTRS